MTAWSGPGVPVPYAGLSDSELLERASRALSAAVTAKPGSDERGMACAEHERIARELARRLQAITGRMPGDSI